MYPTMNITVFDTETTGLLPKTAYPGAPRIINPVNLDSYPYIIQLSFARFNKDKISAVKDAIIKISSNINIPEESIALHHITREISDTKGVPIEQALRSFCKQLFRSSNTVLVAHNLEFDWVMIKVELMRIICNNPHKPAHEQLSKADIKQFKDYLFQIQHYQQDRMICTMKTTTEFCKLPSTKKKDYKWPKLMELHEILFQCIPNNLHNSLYDVLVTLRCFMKYFHEVDLLECCEDFKKHSMELYNIEYVPVLRRSERLKHKYIH